MKASKYRDRDGVRQYVIQNDYGFWKWTGSKWRRFVSGDWYWVPTVKWDECSWLEILMVTGTAKEYLLTALRAEWDKGD